MKKTSRIDLTEGPILKTLIKLAVPVTVSMVMFTVYLMVDLYFVGRLGPDAVAALSISFFFMILLYTIGNCYRGMGNTKTPMIIMLQANLMNIVLDPILIFGWLGLPAMGVRGAALASVISQIYALAIYGYLIIIKGSHIDIKGKWQLSLDIIRKSLYIGIFSNDPEVIRFGVGYLKVFSLGFIMVGAIMVFSAVFQGLGKTYPSLIGAVVDNSLFAGLVFTLPLYFSWGIQSIWWIKLTTAIIETAVVAVWLRGELKRTRIGISRELQPAR